jgi:SAM-dependent methyltransferase
MTNVRASMELALDPAEAFAALVEELGTALGRAGLKLESGVGGRVFEGAVEVGKVTRWKKGEGFALQWHPAPWDPKTVTKIRVTLEPSGKRTQVTFEHGGFGKLLGNGAEQAGWFAGEVLAPLFKAGAPAALGDWFTDRRARRPTGAQARATYREPLYHYPGFRAMLAELALTKDDHLLDVGCGGGAFLKSALESGCRAAGVDHSSQMVRVASEVNREAVAAGRLEVREADAAALPFADGTFSAATMHGVLGWFAQPVPVLAEMRRVLRRGGRLVVCGSDPEMRGTPAAPEPMASRLCFYDTNQLEELGRKAGFAKVRVARPDLAPFAREVGIPKDHLPLFAAGKDGGARFLVARKD